MHKLFLIVFIYKVQHRSDKKRQIIPIIPPFNRFQRMINEVMKTKKIPKTFFLKSDIHDLSSKLHFITAIMKYKHPPKMFAVQFYFANG